MKDSDVRKAREEFVVVYYVQRGEGLKCRELYISCLHLHVHGGELLFHYQAIAWFFFCGVYRTRTVVLKQCKLNNITSFEYSRLIYVPSPTLLSTSEACLMDRIIYPGVDLSIWNSSGSRYRSSLLTSLDTAPDIRENYSSFTDHY